MTTWVLALPCRPGLTEAPGPLVPASQLSTGLHARMEGRGRCAVAVHTAYSCTAPAPVGRRWAGGVQRAVLRLGFAKLPVVGCGENRAGRVALAAAGLRRAGSGLTWHLSDSACVSPLRTLQGKTLHAHPLGQQQIGFRLGVLTLEPDEQVPVRQESVAPGLVSRGSFCLMKSPPAFQSQAPGLPSPSGRN